ncbi:hypothetical protein Tco_0705678 [Tanacetum coccineum]|uniref:Uncharacterized protein n=1 Tax=Tanacetum coccineum TaxID=301880 RepID=A0ABQ4Y7D0_9ASTR
MKIALSSDSEGEEFVMACKGIQRILQESIEIYVGVIKSLMENVQSAKMNNGSPNEHLLEERGATMEKIEWKRLNEWKLVL